jgi:hypothetical protein
MSKKKKDISVKGINKEELRFYDIAARFCGLKASPECLERLILVFQGVKKYKGALNIKHFARIDAFIEEKYAKDSLTLKDDRDDSVNDSVPDSDISGKEGKVEPGDEDMNKEELGK